MHRLFPGETHTNSIKVTPLDKNELNLTQWATGQPFQLIPNPGSDSQPHRPSGQKLRLGLEQRSAKVQNAVYLSNTWIRRPGTGTTY